MLIQAPWEFVEKYYTDDLEERESPESKRFLQWLKYVQWGNILNIGCGPNFYDDVQFFKNIPKELIGIDINENNIEFLKQSKHPELSKRRDFLKSHGVKVDDFVWDIKDKRTEFINQFDTIYDMGVLGMFGKDELVNIFQLLSQYLKAGGRIVHIDWIDSRLTKDKLQERESFNRVKKGPTIEVFGEIMEVCGFKILRHEVYTLTDPENYGRGKIYAYIAEKK